MASTAFRLASGRLREAAGDGFVQRVEDCLWAASGGDIDRAGPAEMGVGGVQPHLRDRGGPDLLGTGANHSGCGVLTVGGRHVFSVPAGRAVLQRS